MLDGPSGGRKRQEKVTRSRGRGKKNNRITNGRNDGWEQRMAEGENSLPSTRTDLILARGGVGLVQKTVHQKGPEREWDPGGGANSGAARVEPADTFLLQQIRVKEWKTQARRGQKATTHPGQAKRPISVIVPFTPC